MAFRMMIVVYTKKPVDLPRVGLSVEILKICSILRGQSDHLVPHYPGSGKAICKWRGQGDDEQGRK
jgi:hypothetical protein